MRRDSKKGVHFDDRPRIEIDFQGKNTKHFRITDVNYSLHQNTKQTKKPRFKTKGSLLTFGEGSIYKDDSDEEYSFGRDEKTDLSESDETERDQPLIETNYAYQKEKECYLRQLRQQSSPSCRIFGVYVTQKNARRSISVQVENNEEAFDALTLRQPSLNVQDDVQRVSKRNLEMNASLVPYFVLNDWVDQLMNKELPEKSFKNKVTIDLNCTEKLYGALLVADVSHFSKLARDYVRDDFKNVHNQNTRSIAAEQLFKLLYQEIFNVIVELITDVGGDIVKFVGDSLFAIFPVSNKSSRKRTGRDGRYFSNNVEAVRGAMYVALKAFQQLDRQVHYGIGYGAVTYHVVGNQRIEGFLSGPALQEATTAEEFSSKFSDNFKYVPLAVSETVLGKIQTMDSLLRKEFKTCTFAKSKGKPKGHVLKNRHDYVEKFIKSLRPNNSTDSIGKIVQKKLSLIMQEPRKCDILRAVLSLATPRVVSNYVSLAGVSLWASELRVCTSMFVLISGDWNSIDAKKLNLLNDIVSRIQESVKDFGGEFLRFVIDDKGAYCFITFGLRPKRVANNAMRATLCAIDIHEKIEHFRREKSVALAKSSKRRISSKKTSSKKLRSTSKKKLRSSFGTLRRSKVTLYELASELNVCIGITTGKVICANVGAASRCEYTLHGECVNYANNLMGFASKIQASKKVKKGKKPLLEAIENIPGYEPRILVGKEVFEATKSHIDYKSRQQDVLAHKRPDEQIKVNGKVVKGKAYIVKGTKLPDFSLSFFGENKDVIKFNKEHKLVGRIHLNSRFQLYIREFAQGKTTELKGVIKGQSGMGKTVALGQLYNQIKEMSTEEHEVIPFLIQSTYIESRSRFFVIRAVLLQLVQVFGRNLKKMWPKNLKEAYEFVTDGIRNLCPGNYSAYKKSLLVPVFKPNGWEVSDEHFYTITVNFRDLVKEVLGKFKCIFLFDDWHLMNATVAQIFLKLVEELKLGIIVTIDSSQPTPFKKVTPLTLEPLSLKDFQAVGERWRRIPYELLKYISEMVNGNPRHAEELLQIVKNAGWIQKDELTRPRYLTLEAFSCIQDKKLEYRDFIVKKKEEEVTDHFLSAVHKATYVLEKMESTSKSTRLGHKTLRGYDAPPSSKNTRSLRDRLLKPEQEDKYVNIKFTEYFDKNMYITEEALTNYLDDTNTIQHMCVKIAAVFGTSFKLKHLAMVLKNFSDDVLDVGHLCQGKNRGAIKAIHGDTDLVKRALTIALKGLEQKHVFKKQDDECSFEEATFEFVTPLLREVTLNYMPQYLKQVIYRIITNQIKRKSFKLEDFSNSLEYNRFVSVFSDLANQLDALDICYQAMKEIEKHANFTGEVKYYFDSMSRLHAWHSFFLLKQKQIINENASTVLGGSTAKMSALNPNHEALSEEALRPFRNWYRNLDKFEVGRSLRIGAEKVLWYSEQSFADKHKGQKHARQIAKFGIKWLEPLVKTCNKKDKVKIQLELVMLYAVDFQARRSRSSYEYPALANTCGDIVRATETEGLSPVEQAQFALPYMLSFNSKAVKMHQNHAENLLSLAQTVVNSTEVSQEERNFIQFKIAEALVRLFKLVSPEASRRCLVDDNGEIHASLRGLFENTTCDSEFGKDLCWRDVKLKYLDHVRTILEEEKEKNSLKRVTKRLFRREFGEKWIENKKLFVQNGVHSALFDFACEK